MTAPAAVAAATTSAPALRAAGWTIIETPTPSANCGPSGKGKNASEAGPRRRDRAPVLPPLRARAAHRVHLAHLAGADPDRLQAFATTIAFEPTCLATPGEGGRPALFVRVRLGHDRHALAVVHLGVGVLDEEAPEHPPKVAIAGAGTAPLAVAQDAQRPLTLSAASPSASYSGAIKTSTNWPARADARAGLRLSATTPP